MSIITRIRIWFSRLGYSDKFFEKTNTLVKELLPQVDAEKKLKEVKNNFEGISQRTRWDTWRLHIHAYQTAENQLILLREILLKVEYVEKLNLETEALGAFLECFSTLEKNASNIKGIKAALEDRQSAWKMLQETIRKVRSPVFFSHSLLRLSDSTRIESASMLVAGLIALGAVYMAFFFESAVGLSASAYWTLDDLLNHGLLVIPAVVGALIGIEGFFFLVRKFGRKNSFKLHLYILNHPVALVLGFFMVVMIFASCWGYTRGTSAWDRFLQIRENTAEMATVSDGTVLHDVYLVGTSDRTAIFLQVRLDKGVDENEKWNAFAEWSNGCMESESSTRDERCRDIGHFGGYVETAKRVGLTFWGGRKGYVNVQNLEENPVSGEAGGGQDSGSSRTRGGSMYEVLVMDRALIVCHGAVGVCNESRGGENPPMPGVMNELQEIGNAVASLRDDMESHNETVTPVIAEVREIVSRRPVQVSDEIVQQFTTHLNEHFPRTMDELARVWSETEQAPPVGNDSR